LHPPGAPRCRLLSRSSLSPMACGSLGYEARARAPAPPTETNRRMMLMMVTPFFKRSISLRHAAPTAAATERTERKTLSLAPMVSENNNSATDVSGRLVDRLSQKGGSGADALARQSTSNPLASASSPPSSCSARDPRGSRSTSFFAPADFDTWPK